MLSRTLLFLNPSRKLLGKISLQTKRPRLKGTEAGVLVFAMWGAPCAFILPSLYLTAKKNKMHPSPSKRQFLYKSLQKEWNSMFAKKAQEITGKISATGKEKQLKCRVHRPQMAWRIPGKQEQRVTLTPQCSDTRADTCLVASEEGRKTCKISGHYQGCSNVPALICTSSWRQWNRQANADLFRPAGFKLMWLLNRSDPCAQMSFCFYLPHRPFLYHCQGPADLSASPTPWQRTDGAKTLKVRAALSRLAPGGTASKTVQSLVFLGKWHHPL